MSSELILRDYNVSQCSVWGIYQALTMPSPLKLEANLFTIDVPDLYNDVPLFDGFFCSVHNNRLALSVLKHMFLLDSCIVLLISFLFLSLGTCFLKPPLVGFELLHCDSNFNEFFYF